MNGGFILMVLFFVTVSVVVGVVAKLLNGLAEANTARRIEEERAARTARMERAAERARAAEDERAERPRPAAARNEEYSGGTVRPPSSDMDRFLAEIDRLRRRAGNPSQPERSAATPVAPVVQPTRPPAERRRTRVVAELAEPPTYGVPAASPPPPPAAAPTFGSTPQAPAREAPLGGQVEQLPVAQVLRPSSSTGAPATKVTRFQTRPAAKTNFGKNLTAILASGQGVAMAVVLQEILGSPKCKQYTPTPPPSSEPAPPTEPSPNGH